MGKTLYTQQGPLLPLHEKAQLTAAPAYSSRRRAKDAGLSHWAMSRPEFCSQLHFNLQFFMLLRNMPPICNNRRRQTLKVLCINVSPENLRDSFKFYIVKRTDFNFDADYLFQVLVSVLVASLTKNTLSKQWLNYSNSSQTAQKFITKYGWLTSLQCVAEGGFLCVP